ncbi:tyrosyl-DNA phosphodiesterase-domain-containing protein [Penicillium argentinense]|uniref:Tyrosyl-DNA phosphodiesterase-domain-containing protein n=1 Tax=Penicillium argentinense TaxID=1131581 RepID=A0A9W9G0E8_9EURO|nr:tyrosyl-DNA phosphodiesterase-domain-containing protein [Penicillium argentinense]KAJ5109826.1 tyrosyl-DNA phosphodiesterase-domain-containing protein [Penicillium argentinense]
MPPDDLYDPMVAAAIKASLEDTQAPTGSASQSSPQAQNLQSRSSAKPVVDLTNDSDNDSDLQVVFPKSNSMVGSETDADASEDDDDLKQAIALSLDTSTSPVNESRKSLQGTPQNQGTKSESSPHNTASGQGFLGLDRKQMEQERLLRLNKRKADSQETSPSQPPAKSVKAHEMPGSSATTVSSASVPGPSSRPANQPTVDGTDIRASSLDIEFVSSKKATSDTPMADYSRQHTSMPQSVPRSGTGIQWALGTVKKTRLSNSPRKPNDISIEEVLQREDLEIAVLSSFLWQYEWVLSKLDTNRTLIRFVVHAETEQQMELEAESAGISNLRFTFPSLEGQISIMHSKLMLLFHPGYLRIAVPTANLIAVDWGVGDVMENSVFIIDLPQKSQKNGPAEDIHPQFYHDLVYFLKASSYPQTIIDKLAGFDFSETARYAFVHTIGGAHQDEKWRWTGYTGLGRAVANLGLRTQAPISVDFITSSLGSLSEDLLRGFYLACKGDDGTTDYQFRNTKPSLRAKSPLQNISREWTDRFRVYFPSARTVDGVARSVHRPARDIGGTVCFSSKYWNAPKMPRHVLKDCQSERNVLMHNKIAFVKVSEPIPFSEDTECRGWAYVGSANLSESAWGRLVKDRVTGAPKLNCRNWECGVLIPVISEISASKAPADSRSETDSNNLSVALFNDTIPVPMKTPAENLAAGREPWFFRD